MVGLAVVVELFSVGAVGLLVRFPAACCGLVRSPVVLFVTWLEGGLGGVLVVCGVRLACCEVFPVIMGDGYSFRDQNLEF